jgi:hypothetical protein
MRKRRKLDPKMFKDGPGTTTVRLFGTSSERDEQLDEMHDEGLRVLERRKGEIVDGQLDGEHWFIAILKEAKSVIANQRALAERRPTETRT